MSAKPPNTSDSISGSLLRTIYWILKDSIDVTVGIEYFVYLRE